MVALTSEYRTLKGKADESCLRLAWATYRDLVPRNIDPRTMSVMEGIPQDGATFIEWNKQWVQAAQVV